MTSVELSAMPRVKCAKPQEWNIGAASMGVLAGAQRDHVEQRGGRIERLGLAPLGPLGAACRAAREDDHAALPAGRLDVGGVARADEILEPRVLGRLIGVVPGDEALAALARVVHEVLVLGVGVVRGRLLALGDLADLRPGERGVEVQRVGAELGQRDRRVDEARWSRHIIATLDPSPTPRARREFATAFVRRWTSANVSVPRSSMIAVASGWRIALTV